MKRFYFTIPSANIWEVVYAQSFEDAKHQAFKDYSSMWNEIEWVHLPKPPATRRHESQAPLTPEVEQKRKLRSRRRRVTFESASQHPVARDTAAPENTFA
jgi:hypothetical protein